MKVRYDVLAIIGTSIAVSFYFIASGPIRVLVEGSKTTSAEFDSLLVSAVGLAAVIAVTAWEIVRRAKAHERWSQSQPPRPKSSEFLRSLSPSDRFSYQFSVLTTFGVAFAFLLAAFHVFPKAYLGSMRPAFDSAAMFTFLGFLMLGRVPGFFWVSLGAYMIELAFSIHGFWHGLRNAPTLSRVLGANLTLIVIVVSLIANLIVHRSLFHPKRR